MMITVNVESDCNLWFTKIKKPKKYFNKNLKKISKLIPLFRKKKINFTILLTNSTSIKKLNKKYRNINKKTDVLSFPFYLKNKLKLIKEQNIYIGDIAVCYEIIKKRSSKNDFFIEFNKVWIHGLLHLIGYDHIKDKDYFKMQKIEKKFLNSIIY